MNRLTTDTPNSNVESMLNFAYAKDKKIFLRNATFDGDVELSEYIEKELGHKFSCSPTAKEISDGLCLECNCPITAFIIVATQAAELRERLKQYEDEKEQKLKELTESENQGVPD